MTRTKACVRFVKAAAVYRTHHQELHDRQRRQTGGVSRSHDDTQAPHRYPDLSQNSRGRLLYVTRPPTSAGCSTTPTTSSRARGASARACSSHLQGAVRGQRGAVRGTAVHEWDGRCATRRAPGFGSGSFTAPGDVQAARVAGDAWRSSPNATEAGRLASLLEALHEQPASGWRCSSTSTTGPSSMPWRCRKWPVPTANLRGLYAVVKDCDPTSASAFSPGASLQVSLLRAQQPHRHHPGRAIRHLRVHEADLTVFAPLRGSTGRRFGNNGYHWRGTEKVYNPFGCCSATASSAPGGSRPGRRRSSSRRCSSAA